MFSHCMVPYRGIDVNDVGYFLRRCFDVFGLFFVIFFFTIAFVFVPSLRKS